MVIFNTLLEIFIAYLIVVFLWVKNRPKPNVILGIYKKNVYFYWPKYFLMLCLIKLQNVSYHDQFLSPLNTDLGH